jgi:hypothetical protein
MKDLALVDQIPEIEIDHPFFPAHHPSRIVGEEPGDVFDPIGGDHRPAASRLNVAKQGNTKLEGRCGWSLMPVLQVLCLHGRRMRGKGGLARR